MSLPSEYVQFLIALLAIVDIPGNVPMFLRQTEGFTTAERRVTALAAGAATASVLLLFVFMGETILEVFGISIEAFKIVGGLVILVMAFQMLGLVGGDTDGSRGNRLQQPVAVGIFPMAIPLLAGPGAMSAVLVYAHHDYHPGHDLIISSVIVTVSLLIVVSLTAASFVGHLLGPVTQSVISRLLGIIVATMGIEFLIDGLSTAFPNLTGEVANLTG